MPHAVPNSTDDLRTRLQASLGEAFSIEHELRGGGMSRVFVARENALGRRVVVKVLSPELGGVNVERFRREIQLAAGLQHPHIVPVHISGELNGSPYYTMPFIEGESLRARLATGQATPLPEVLRILRDVIGALAYAHARGVVHRDIKPDNILMSHAHAVVTDFGVAKALSAANRDGVGAGETGIGVAIGTPAYMAPEQAAGDPDTDHRADIYGFGVLAYELLGGHPPFHGRAPHELLAAQITETPVEIGEIRPETPPALARLVMRCLAKNPDERPQDALAVLEELDTIVTPGFGTTASTFLPRGARRRRWVGGAGTAALLAAAVAAYIFWPQPAAPDEHVVAVAPFRVLTNDPSLRYLGEGMLDLLAAKLTGEGGPRSADPRSLLSAWRRAAGSDTAELSRERALTVAEGLGAGQLLLGDISGTWERIVLNAALVRVRDGRAQAQASVTGPSDSLPQMVDQLTAKLLAIGAGEEARLATLTSTSLPALRSYLDAQRLYRLARYREAAQEFERALQHDSTFALAAIGLTAASGWFGDPAKRFRGMKIAHQYRSRLSSRDNVLRASMAGPNFPGSSSYSEIYAAKQRYLELAPDDPGATFEVGDALFHYGAVLGIADAHAQAATFFRRTLGLDSAFAPAMEHLLLLEARAGDTAAVRRVGTLYLTTDSATENADGVRWRMAVALGDSALRREVLSRAARISPVSANTIGLISLLDGVDLDGAEVIRRSSNTPRGAGGGSPQLEHDIALNLGRPSRALALTRLYAQTNAMPRSDLRDHIKDALYWDGDSAAAVAAARELERGFARVGTPTGSEYSAHYADLCIVEQWRLGRGDASRTDATIATLLASSTAPEGESFKRYTSGCAVLLDALRLAVLRDPALDTHRATARLDSLTRLGPGAMLQDVGNLIVARLKEAEGDLPGALAAVRRREYFLSRPTFLSTYLREEGRLAALTGDREGAIAAYRHYLALRADPEITLAAADAAIRDELRRLERESAGT